MKLNRRHQWMIATITVVLLSEWLVLSSSAFRECIDDPNNQQAEQTSKEEHPLIPFALRNGAGCAWHSVDENAEGLIALFTIVLGGGTLWLAKETGRLAKDSRESSQRELRAYISISAEPPGLRAPTINFIDYMATITVRNLGRTPAYITDAKFGCRWYRKGDKPPLPLVFHPPQVATKTFLTPQDSFYVLQRVPWEDVDGVESFCRHECELWFFAYVNFRDVFDRKYQVGWARKYKPLRDIPGIHGQRAEYATTLVQINQPGYNYERPHDCEEG